jgi:hypothetical protein
MTYEAAQARGLPNYSANVSAKFHDLMFKNLSETTVSGRAAGPSVISNSKGDDHG